MIIDPHVHLRDWEQIDKESLYHGMESAMLCGVCALFDMPNCQPPLIDEYHVRRRLSDAAGAAAALSARAKKAAPFYALYGGLTSDGDQVAEMVALWRELFPRVIGMKLFAGRSTGSLAVVEKERQEAIWERLARESYKGLVAVHCEKEGLFSPDLWDPAKPSTHSLARPEEAEAASVADQIASARLAGFSGTLHICHISSPDALRLVEEARRASADGELSFRITCGATPHHLLLDSSLVPEGEDGLLFKVNPPLRSPESRSVLWDALVSGRIDWIESDHAPHRIDDKRKGFASGLPSLVAWPLLIREMRRVGMSEEKIEMLTAGNAIRSFGLESGELPDYPKEGDGSVDAAVQALCGRYEANGWSRYLTF